MKFLSLVALTATYLSCHASPPKEAATHDLFPFCLEKNLRDEYNHILNDSPYGYPAKIPSSPLQSLDYKDLLISPISPSIRSTSVGSGSTILTPSSSLTLSSSAGSATIKEGNLTIGGSTSCYHGTTTTSSESLIRFLDFTSVVDETLAQDALTQDDFRGPCEDYLVLHCLIKKYQPKTLFQIGTYRGDGTLTIKNAMGDGTVYSLELLPNMPTAYYFLYPKDVGSHCYLPYIQLFGDSMTYDYTKHYPLDAWFIDGRNDYNHVFYESKEALLSKPSLCVWRNTDIPEVFQAIIDTFGKSPEYNVYLVQYTSITYAIKKSLDDRSR